ncbi:MAG: DMT family transporter [Candidatus Acidiferrales bacterium]
MSDAGSSSKSALGSRPSTSLLVLALLAVLFAWSVNYIVGKITLTHFNALTLASFRLQISAMVLLSLYFSRRNRTPLDRRDLWTFAYLGFFGYAINQGGFVTGLSLTTSEHSVIIVALGPILILAMARAMGLETLTPGKVFGMLISFCGVIVLETDSGSPLHSPLLFGDLISLAGTLGYSIYTVLAKRVAGTYDTISINAFSATVGAIVWLPVALRQGSRLHWAGVGLPGWAGLLYMALFSSVGGYLLFYWLLRHMEASRVVVVNYFQPVVVVLLSIPVLAERPTTMLLVSGVLVLLGVYLTERASARERAQKSSVPPSAA